MRVRHSQGFALTEVLVAAALLVVGLLGQLAVLAAAIRTEREAAQLATAATLAADIGERIRANPGAAPGYALDPEALPATGTDCALATPQDAATRSTCDLDEWQREVVAALPGAGIEIITAAGAGSVLCTITIRWSTQDAGGAAYTLQLQV
jgi:type IV pilus assembly protein PilV